MINFDEEDRRLYKRQLKKDMDCRFDMIDVEDPLWEYGSPLKRVLIDDE